ncbi:peptide ABC transporter substrate-binding protein [Aphanothece hegewaldii CCALA 016]|uniref:Peptide ABC transporter substrate-binding protein n=1 Tax=Aphanothece hegewaldii CCALA 016 TaxID=2107694 RepID=A0A2T1LRH3_9CHRO|nr:ABC transporter substrate-binding protein [Aphanothece hegewaldii]PSF31295.1 peptide ABC transporter substrate-binding protein [Aphanothece hegewaldii CCALA 016]
MKIKLSNLGKLLILFFFCVAVVVGCHSQNTHPTNSTINQNGRVTIGTTLKTRTLDPADNYELAGMILSYNLGETLYTYKPGTTNLIPLLAREMPKISDDGLIYTIPLRNDVIFHDGTPFNAQAMVFSLRRFIENGGEPSFLLSDAIAKVEATGDDEIQIKLKSPFAAFTALLAFPGACAVSPKAYEIGEGKFVPDQFVGTGPYKLVEVKNDSLKLAPFEQYWGEKPKNKGIDLQIYLGNPANLFNAFSTGTVDVAYQSLQAPQIRKLQTQAKEGKWQVIEASGTAISFLALNVKTEPVKEKAVRKAIASLIDRSLLNERILQGQGEPLYSLIPKTFDVYKPVFQEQYGDHQIEKAKQYLIEAGFTKENPAIVEIWHSSSSVTASMVAGVLKALAKRDLDDMITIEPNSIASAAYFKNVSRGLYSSALSNWYPDFLDADNYIQPFLSCSKGSPQDGCSEGGSQSQGSFFYNQVINTLIEQQRQEQDPKIRQNIFAQIQDILAQEVPYIPLWQSKDYAFVQNKIKGMILNPNQLTPFWTIQPI